MKKFPPRGPWRPREAAPIFSPVGMGDDPPQPGQGTEASIKALSEFLDDNRSEIMARWERSLRQILGAHADGFDQSIDPLADLLEQFSVLMDGEGADTALPGERTTPGAERNVELGPLVTSYVLLRDTVVELWSPPPRGSAAALRMLDQAVDRAILGAVRRFSNAQEAAWRAVDRVSELVRQGGELPSLLDGLQRIVLESVPVADCAAILLREDDRLVLRGALGMDEDLAAGFTERVGEGFAGAVALRRAPMLLRWGARDPLVRGESVRRRGVRALFGLPLVDADQLVGVALVGSLTAFDFCESDRRLFGALLDRGTAAIQLQRLRAATDEQARQLAEVQDALRARDRVLSSVAHEVRTPIGIVLMQADSIVHRPPAQPDADWLPKRVSSIQRAAERIDRLVEDLVEFTNLRAGRLKFTIGAHAPADLVREAVEMLQPLAQERGVVVESELSAGLPDLSCDRERILQVFNLLTANALRAMPDGGCLALRAQHDDMGVVFSVEDTGPRIDPTDLPHLFDRAWRGERGRPGRSGTGLAISKGIVEAHGGRIWVASEPGGGATFCFAVPTARA
jgi:signal transduction histidine kinase